MVETVTIDNTYPFVLSRLSEVFERVSRFSLVTTANTAEAFIGVVIRLPVRFGIIDWNLSAIDNKRLVKSTRDQPGPPSIVVYRPRREIAVH